MRVLVRQEPLKVMYNPAPAAVRAFSRILAGLTSTKKGELCDVFTKETDNTYSDLQGAVSRRDVKTIDRLVEELKFLTDTGFEACGLIPSPEMAPPAYVT